MEKQTNPNKPFQVWLPMWMAVMVIIGMIIGMKIAQNDMYFLKVVNKDGAEITRNQPSVDEVIRYVEAQYVDSVDGSALRKKAIDAVIAELDPHTTFINKKELVAIEEKMQGNFEGIGVEFMIFGDTVYFLNIVEDGPAYKAGAQKGDRVITVGDSVIAGKNLSTSDIVSMLKGPAGTTASIEVMRKGSASLVPLDIERGSIKLPSVSAAFKLTDDVAYIRIERFSGQTYSEFMQSLDKFSRDNSFKHLVIDLRDNPGGYLHQAVDILSQFFDDKGQLLVYTEGLKSKKAEYKATGKRLLNVEKIAVIVNEGSASASEILAGAIQDLDRGVIVGRRTYGKGLVQDQYQLSDGSALRLTISRYYTPSGRLIQKNYGDGVEYGNDFKSRLERGELFFEDSIFADNSQAFYTSSGREVSGGNGIVPDIFVPMDSIYLNHCFQNVYGILEEFALRQFMNNDLTFESEEELVQYIDEHPTILNDFFDQIRKNDCDGIEAFLKRPEDMKQSIASFMGKYYFGRESFFRIMMQGDPAVDQAVEALKNKDPFFATKQ